MTDEKKIEVLNAYNDYIIVEFNADPYATFEDAIYDGQFLIGIAYTEYYGDGSFDYDTIHVCYDFNAETYMVFLGYEDREDCIKIDRSIDGLIEDLRHYSFDDFIDIDGNYNNYNKA